MRNIFITFLIQFIISALRAVIAFITVNQYFIFEFFQLSSFTLLITPK